MELGHILVGFMIFCWILSLILAIYSFMMVSIYLGIANLFNVITFSLILISIWTYNS